MRTTIFVLDDGETYAGEGYEVSITEEQERAIAEGEKVRDVVPDWDRQGAHLNPFTVRLLAGAREVRWDNTYGHFANAVKAWQAAGCPDLPENCSCDCPHCVLPQKSGGEDHDKGP